MVTRGIINTSPKLNHRYILSLLGAGTDNLRLKDPKQDQLGDEKNIPIE